MPWPASRIDALAIGGAACALHRRGYRWREIARALDLPREAVRELVLLYLVRLADTVAPVDRLESARSRRLERD